MQMSKQSGDFSKDEVSFKSVGKKKTGKFVIYYRFTPEVAKNLTWMRSCGNNMNSYRVWRRYSKQEVAEKALADLIRKYEIYEGYVAEET